MSFYKKISSIKPKQKVILFTTILILTILITRFTIYYIIDPNPSLLGLELHHFDYGLIILIITSISLLFAKKQNAIYVIDLSISIGFIIDELWFIRKQVGRNNPLIYNLNFPGIIAISLLTIIIATIIYKISKK